LISNSHTIKSKSLRVLLFILLIALGVLGNYFNFSIFPGIDFIFGSIFIYIIFHLYGLTWGIVSAIAISSYTYFIWDHFYAVIIFTVEAIATILIDRKRKNLIISNSIFWILLGLPFNFIVYPRALSFGLSDILLIGFKDMINGIFNVLIASLLIGFALIFFGGKDQKLKEPIRINQMIFNLVTGCVIIPAILINILNANNLIKLTMDSVKSDSEYESIKVVKTIRDWQYDHLNGLSVVQSNVLSDESNDTKTIQSQLTLIGKSFPAFRSVYIGNSEGISTSFYPEKNQIGESTIGMDFSDRKYFQDVRSTKKEVISDIFVGRLKPTPTVSLAVPIIKDEDFIGYVTGTIDLKYFANELIKNNMFQNKIVTITDSNNKVIASTDTDISLNENYDISNRNNNLIFHDVKLSLPKEFSQVHRANKFKQSFFVNVDKVGLGSNWNIIIQIPMIGYYEQMQMFYLRGLFVVAFLTFIALCLAHLLCRLITKPLYNLNDVTTHLSSKVIKGESILWPKSIIEELSILINNFKTTADTLKINFENLSTAKHELETIAYQDSLTGLSNRDMFIERLNDLIIGASHNNKKIAVMFIDLDRFKIINDTLGHDVGDLLLISVTYRLTKAYQKKENVFRIGGDEFIIILEDADNESKIASTAERILSEMQEPFILSGQEFIVTASIGISAFPESGKDFSTLLKNADIAMYRAKEQGKNTYEFYKEKMDIKIQENLIIEKNLRRAIDRNEFLLFYQPQINLYSGEITGAEALIRWNNPELGLVSPVKFIPLAEETGLITQIGEWVLREACRQNKAWQDEGLKPIKISVNLSGKQFDQKELAGKVNSILIETGLSPNWLELEITESIIIKNVDYTVKMLQEFKDMGVKVSLDDFGTGFSSLSYLKNFKIDTLKIDSTFVQDINNEGSGTDIINTIILLAKNLSMKIVAEGVETRNQLEFLKVRGCDEIQGYIYSKPLCPKDFEAYVRGSSFR
jgi:diguanylate cyclase (GGDEF)-like protein